MSAPSAAERYTAILKNSRKGKLPPGYPLPQPPALWPAENVELLERYLRWLHNDNAGPTTIDHYYLPAAGHVLGYHLQPHATLDISAGAIQALDPALERVMDYFKAKQLNERALKLGRQALERFRRFMHEERGYARLPDALSRPPRIEQYQEGLPAWLVEQLGHYQQIRQANWRQSRLAGAIANFWRSHTELWRWLFAREQITSVGDVKRTHLYAYIDERLAAGYSVRSINLEVRVFQATLRFLQERAFEVPQALLRRADLRQPETLPRFLTDEQVGQLQAEFERSVEAAASPARRRNALLDRALFYLLWQGGLRGAEVEELRLADLNLAGQQILIRGGKGNKDRAVYLTERTCAAVETYQTVRGSGTSDHLFLYRHERLGKDLVRNRIKAAGRRAGVKVTPHQLRHIYATQLVNAGCRITTIQALMGHKRLHTTLVYTQVHNRTVADDYYTAMEKVEKRLEEQLPHPSAEDNGNGHHELLALVDALDSGTEDEEQQALVEEIRQGLLALAT